ncbi:hypothetical protein HIM_08119 [Hirsutella minnesotensis 3608]|uniref:Major facilitator superfamily (MFS) profile domain-containing protein n=1 Tax=Hirsutella minnesotensis 3608 TaxID=1043627 RepID=A0A0F7ZMR3_9HYPO|nr:hypothetical protein HIM_08119 [Hirsutella minnesotensis 3608]
MATTNNAGHQADGTARSGSHKLSHWRMVIDQAGITPEVVNHPYAGSGTAEDPFLVKWIPNDPRNPMLFDSVTKWFITMTAAIVTLAVALVSSAFTGGIGQIVHGFDISQEVATLGVSLFVLGFAVGPLLWAPLSELFGRQVLFLGTYAALTAFNAGCAGAQNPWTLIILRFFAGAFGSSPLTNAGGTIADMFPSSERGLALAIFAAAPFLGPVLGPVIGGFIGMTAGWRWVMGFLAIFSGALWVIGGLCIPETYSPVLLRRRAAKLSQMTGRCYVSAADHAQEKVTLGESIKAALLRPWILLFREPIVLLLSIFMAIIYGTLYMLFAAFPIVYQKGRGWNQGVAGLAFLGIMVGMFLAIAYTIPSNKRYIRIEQKHGGFAPPEARLPAAMIGSIALPVGLFWFAWTNSSSIHWLVSIAAGVPFGFGMVLVFLSIMNYLIDAYTIFAASVLAANSLLRSLFGASFPLFTGYMYDALGIHWASSIPAFLALACVPFPFLFYKYGPAIRERCKFAAQSAAFVRALKEQPDEPKAQEHEKEPPPVEKVDSSSVDGTSTDTAGTEEPTYGPINFTASRTSIRTAGSTASRAYEGNPYDIDRVNTKHSFVN